jgi:hypothetical protein
LTLLQALILYSGENYWLWAFAGLGFGAYWFYLGFRLLQRRRLILDTPASKVRSASIGMVELSGLAAGPYTMTAPLTGAACYYYRTLAWQWKQSGKNSHWEKVADESLFLPFYLDDNTGKVLVNPQGAELDLHRDFQDEVHSSLFSSLSVSGNVSGFLLRHGIDTDKKLKLEEYCIKPKNALFILGTLAPNPGVSVSATPIRGLSSDPIRSAFHLNLSAAFGSFSDSLATENIDTAASSALQRGAGMSPEIIRLQGNEPPADSAGMNQQEKLSAALMKAGITNPAAWAAAGVPYAGVAVSTAGHSTGGTGAAVARAPVPEFDLTPKTVVMKGENNPSFFISWRSQREVAQALGWKSTLMIWGGPALFLLSLHVLLAHFGWI